MGSPSVEPVRRSLPPPSVREDPALAATLVARLPPGPWSRSFSVTDLIDPRRAYYRLTRGPPPASAERQARLDSGRAVHRSIDEALPGEGRFEVRVRRDGVSARIDLLADVPVEIKSGSEPPPEDLVGGRTEYIEQMAMYCGLLRASASRLVHVQRPDSSEETVRAFDVAFTDPAVLRDETLRRLEGLRRALAEETPEGLVACRWFGRGCEYQRAGLCDCAGTEPSPGSEYAEQVVGVVVRGDIAERWQRALREHRSRVPSSIVPRYRSLVFPRRAYFELVPSAPTAAEPSGPPERPASDVYDTAVGVLEGGPAGDVHRLRVGLRAPLEEVAGWSGEPYIVRTSRAWSRVSGDAVLGRFPQYALELGLRCAASGTDRGRVVLAYERAESPAERLQVLEFTFGSGIAAYAEELEDRIDRLERAVRGGRADTLEACAGWMVTDCPYRERCGCGSDAARSQR